MAHRTSSVPALSYTDSGGDGRPVVLIHGWPLSKESWDGNIAALTDAGLRVITYDRRGFGQSDKPRSEYDYDTLSDDLHRLMTELELIDASLVGFSMGGGEVARYIKRHGEEALRSVVFASAVPPYLMKTADNPEGPLTQERAAELEQGLLADPDAFYDGFTTTFFSVQDHLKVTEAQRQAAIAMCMQADPDAAHDAMLAFASTDFRDDLKLVTVPALVIHGDGDATVPFEGSGRRTHELLAQSDLCVIVGGPHGINVANQDEFNDELVAFLLKY